MSFKDQLKLFPHDKLSHYQWASWFATIAAIAAMLVVFFGAAQPLGVAALAGAAASTITAYAAGKLGELSDERANEDAEVLGTPLREVSDADVKASLLGCIPSALPLFAVFLLSLVSR